MPSRCCIRRQAVLVMSVSGEEHRNGRRRRSRHRSTRSVSVRRCWWTPTTSPRAWRTPWRWPDPSSARSVSTPVTWACSRDRCATRTRIVVSGDLDEFAIAELRAEPVDIFGVGTSVVTGSGAPTASMVYKLVEVDGIPVEKRSSHKESYGGRKQATRLAKQSGTIVEEIVHPFGRPPSDQPGRALTVELVR